MARPLRIEYPGVLYYVMIWGTNHQAISHDDHYRATRLEKLIYYYREKDVHLFFYCLLFDHVYLLVEIP